MSRGNEIGERKKRENNISDTQSTAPHRTYEIFGVCVYERGQENRHRRLIKERRKTRVNCVVFGWRHLKCSNDSGDDDNDDDCGGASDGGGGGMNGCAFAISLPKTPFPTLPFLSSRKLTDEKKEQRKIATRAGVRKNISCLFLFEKNMMIFSLIYVDGRLQCMIE